MDTAHTTAHHSVRQIELCRGVVIHQRLRPAVHAFRYGVFFLRIPLQNLEQQSTDAGCRLFSLNRWNCLSFYNRDHGDGQGALLTWAQQILHAHGVHDADGDIVLQCFPRVFGYVFNPVSFWFCYRRDGALRAILCEVNNTFGEKHVYLLAQDAALTNGQEYQAEKIFHVSPFCEVQGRYRFRFLHRHPTQHTQHADSVPAAARYLAKIDYDDAAGPLLLTSVSGQAGQLSDRCIAFVMLRYPLMTLAVMWRIHWQALRLWIKRVPFFTKPSPPQQEVSR
ncbi:DUF1365 domain-containing protein [Undibacterium sp. CY7W]|uniref:DUF1365 domain-containing protein n=1 Tax=Undibacterium rugosum TaxID=2762291 RepID=A0A923I7K8_9BURK|nr:DUF1365 domain-containing protein [Undibacterium rugosum]MBC3934110.1 DUF1365 domain-containing protein [Undibacterium rugosum]